jgi:hypothetical protein
VRDKAVEEFSLRTFVYTAGVDKRLLVAIETLPSKGIFEATVQYEGESNMKVLGEISRINRYNKQTIQF